MFYKKVKSIVSRVDTKTGLNMDIDKSYCIFLIRSDSEDDYSGEFYIMKGRKEVFDYLINYAITGEYDLIKSQILSENMSLGNEVSIYTFLRLAIEKYQYDDQYRLSYIDEIIYSNNPNITPEALDRFYMSECNQSAR